MTLPSRAIRPATPTLSHYVGLSAFLIAAGAILAWAVTYETEGAELNQVGIILFFVGIGLCVVTLAASATGRRTTINAQRDTVVDGRPAVQRERETIVENDSRI